MAEISKDDLREEINAILKDADLRVMSAKKVRQQVEEKLDCNLNARKKEIDELVMNYVNSKEDEENEEVEEEDDEEEDEDAKKKPAKRPAPKKPAPKSKKSKANSSDDENTSNGSKSDGSDDEEYEAKKPVPKKKAPPRKKGKGSDSDSDSEWSKRKAKPATGRGKGGGYTRAYKLSPALASLMGQESMARHEVVKKVWAIIKEKNLYDQSNKQFAICDDDLYKVMGVKRFRTFGMMKYLKTHFHD